jgi:hypothetical protein
MGALYRVCPQRFLRVGNDYDRAQGVRGRSFHLMNSWRRNGDGCTTAGLHKEQGGGNDCTLQPGWPIHFQLLSANRPTRSRMCFRVGICIRLQLSLAFGRSPQCVECVDSHIRILVKMTRLMTDDKGHRASSVVPKGVFGTSATREHHQVRVNRDCLRCRLTVKFAQVTPHEPYWPQQTLCVLGQPVANQACSEFGILL